MPDNYNRSPERSVQQGAETARQAGHDVGDLVYEKQLAYGDSSGLMHGFWHMALRQYKTVSENGAEVYAIPVALVDHMPRLTRVLDRVFRLVGNPTADRMGEDPWRDLAGDAVCGIVMPRTQGATAADVEAVAEPEQQAGFDVWDTVAHRAVAEATGQPTADVAEAMRAAQLRALADGGPV